MTQSAYFEAYGGSGPENYERYFVPAIGRPLARELVAAAALQPGDRVSMSPVARESSLALRPKR
ncbi:MAG: hypothetical protein R2849_09920 [Thermomicrobiales bacterium]